jgi:excinuclease UvrABC helicase subunit UvrB
MRSAIEETNRRRDIQVAYNQANGITPESIVKGVSDIVELLGLSEDAPSAPRTRRGEPDALADVDADELDRMIVEREQAMFAAAEELRFELAARLRDEIADLRQEQVSRAQGAGGGDGLAPPSGAARQRGSAPVPRKQSRRSGGSGRGRRRR